MWNSFWRHSRDCETTETYNRPGTSNAPIRGRIPVGGGLSDQPWSPFPSLSPSHFLSGFVNTGGQDGWARKACPHPDLTQNLGRSTPKAPAPRNMLHSIPGPGRHAHAQTSLRTLGGVHRRPLLLGTCFTLSLTENAHPTSQAPEKPLPKANFPTNSQLWAPCQARALGLKFP